MLHAVVMAGGSGTRFWPASRKALPKQLLSIAGDRSMLELTFDRLKGLCQDSQLTVITNRSLVDPIRRQLPGRIDVEIIGEPVKRDTAPAVALSAALIARRDPQAVMAVMPSDHLIRDAEAFRQALVAAEELVAADPTRIVTFGIPPTHPADIYGYIERDSATVVDARCPTFAVLRFREKPSAATAQHFLAAGGFYWNAGIFVWRAETILGALREFEPELMVEIDAIAAAAGTPDFERVLDERFAAIRGKSIDYAVMERYRNILVMESPFDWDDVGSWKSLERIGPQDERGNTVQAARFLGMDTNGCIIRGSGQRLIVTLGVENLIVVQTEDATLIANKDDEAAVKRVVEALEQNSWHEYL